MAPAYGHMTAPAPSSTSTSADLKDTNLALREENTSLRAYIDNLLLSVINTTPEILEVPQPSQRCGNGFAE